MTNYPEDEERLAYYERPWPSRREAMLEDPDGPSPLDEEYDEEQA